MSASICSEIRMMPSSAVSAEPARPVTKTAVSTGPSSRTRAMPTAGPPKASEPPPCSGTKTWRPSAPAEARSQARPTRPSRCRAPVHAQRPEREILRVQVVLEVEDPREARAVPERIFPGAVGVLPVDQVTDALLDRRPAGAPSGEEGQQRPGRLARKGLAASGQIVVLVGAERLAPAAVGGLTRLGAGDGPPAVAPGDS